MPEMELFDLSFDSPAENLAFDEAMLEAAEAGEQPAALRLWESPAHFVVLGAGCRVRDDVNLDACTARGIPVLRRCSGGGTVVQGPGCLNFALALASESHPELATITGTNAHILGRMCQALDELFPGIRRDGISDLSLGGMKVSGTAQKRKRRCLLFHGTLLYAFDLSLVPALLREPGRQPEYRARRTHASFVANLSAPPGLIRQAIAGAWGCAASHPAPPRLITRAGEIALRRYASDDYTFSL